MYIAVIVAALVFWGTIYLAYCFGKTRMIQTEDVPDMAHEDFMSDCRGLSESLKTLETELRDSGVIK